MDTVDRTKGAERGFSVLEILLAMAIFSITMYGVIATSGGFSETIGTGASSILAGETNVEATAKAQALLEQAQQDARLNFDTLISQALVTDGIYSKKLDVTVETRDHAHAEEIIGAMAAEGFHPVRIHASDVME